MPARVNAGQKRDVTRSKSARNIIDPSSDFCSFSCLLIYMIRTFQCRFSHQFSWYVMVYLV